MPYNNTTPGKYKIPYWSRGERASEESNKRAAQIVENQIKSATQFFGANGTIQEGTYTGIFATGASIVTLAANGAVPALEAVIDSKYANQTTTLQWTSLPDSSTIYLYAQAIEQNIYLTSQASTLQDMVVQAVWNTSGATPSGAILLAIATTTGAAISIDSSSTITDNGTYSTGKPIYYSFSTHRTAHPIDHPNYSVSVSKLDFRSGLDVPITGNVVLTGSLVATSGLSAQFAAMVSGVGAPTGYTGRVAFYRKLLGVLEDPLTVRDEILLPGFRYPAVISEVLVQPRVPPYASSTFTLRNARTGGGSALTATLRASEYYASGLGALATTAAGEIAFRPTTIGSLFSGLSVFITGYQTVPTPSPDNP